MARRPDPERITTARREAQLAKLRSVGLSSERALAELRKTEQWALARGMNPTSRDYWDSVRQVLGEEFG